MKGSNLIRDIFQFVECSQAGTSKEIIIEEGFEEVQNSVIFNRKVRELKALKKEAYIFRFCMKKRLMD